MFIVTGYGKSKEESVEDKGKFLHDFMKAINMDRPVIVSPSMSGSFALPYLLSEPLTSTDRARGYIPVAPITTENYTDEQYRQCTVSRSHFLVHNTHKCSCL